MIRTTIEASTGRTVVLRVEADEPIPKSLQFWMFALLEHDETSPMGERVLRGDGVLDMEHEAIGDPWMWDGLAAAEILSASVEGNSVTIELAKDGGLPGLVVGNALTTGLTLRPPPAEPATFDGDRATIVSREGNVIVVQIEIGTRCLPKQSPYFVLLFREAMEVLGVGGALKDALPKSPDIRYEENPDAARAESATFITDMERLSLEGGSIESELVGCSVLAEPPKGTLPTARFRITVTDPKWIAHLPAGTHFDAQVSFPG